MAISIRGNATAWAASNATTQTVTLPAHAAGDMLLVRAACKPYTATITCSTDGWNPVGDQYANGSTANGNGVGSLAFRAFYKIATSDAETNPVVTWGTTSAPGVATAVVYQPGAGEAFITPTGAGGGDATARTSQTCTISSHISTTAGDMVDFYLAWCDNYASTSPTFTQTGVAYNTVAEQPATAGSFSDSNDIAADGGYRLASSGTSSAAAVVTATFGNSEQGGAWTTRLRVIAAANAPAGLATTMTGAVGATGKTVKPSAAAATATGAALAPDYVAIVQPLPGPSVRIKANAGAGAATSTPYNVTATTGAPETFADAGLAEATAAVSGIGKTVAAAAGLATGTGAVPTVAVSVKPRPALVNFIGLAYDAPMRYAPVGLASGTGAANAPPAWIRPNTDAPTGAGSPAPVTPKVAPAAQTAALTGTSLAPAARIYAAAGLAGATGAAAQPSASTSGAAAAGLATGTGTASNVTATTSSSANAPAGLAEAAGTATDARGAVAGAAGPATATGAGSAAATAVAASVGISTASGTALAPGSWALSPAAGIAAATGAAGNVTATTTGTTNAQAGLAEATGTATQPDYIGIVQPLPGPSTGIAPNAGLAAATGSAGNVTATAVTSDVFVNAGAAAGSGAAYETYTQQVLPNPSVSIKSNAGQPAATGTAWDSPLGPSWTSPADATGMSDVPELKFIIPDADMAQHFWLELDTAATFDTANLRTKRSDLDQTSWDYWDGDSWEPVPVGGVAVDYVGNEARYTVQTPLAAGTWYRRVKAGSAPVIPPAEPPAFEPSAFEPTAFPAGGAT